MKVKYGYFSPSNFVKYSFQKDERVFFQKILPMQRFFYFLQLYSFLIFCKKTSQLRWKKHFLEKISFDTHFAANFQKTQTSYVFEKSYCSSRILRQVSYILLIKNFKIQSESSGNFQLARKP